MRIRLMALPHSATTSVGGDSLLHDGNFRQKVLGGCVSCTRPKRSARAADQEQMRPFSPFQRLWLVYFCCAAVASGISAVAGNCQDTSSDVMTIAFEFRSHALRPRAHTRTCGGPGARMQRPRYASLWPFFNATPLPAPARKEPPKEVTTGPHCHRPIDHTYM